MNSNFISVPFKGDSSSGLREYYGIAKFSQAGIVIELESKLLGLVGGEVQEVRIPLEEILDIKFRKGIFRFFSKIQLRLKNFTKISKLPNESGKVKLKLKREDFERGQKAVELIEQCMNAPNEQLPPAPTSVGELFETQELKTNEIKESAETKKLNE